MAGAPRRIVSLVPHATELLFALGLGDRVVGVTHECDHPAAARTRAHVTADELPPGLSAPEIDAAVRERTAAGEAIYRLDRDALAALEPDLVVTQELCPVCAVSAEEVRDVAGGLPTCPKVLTLDPHTFGETLSDVRTVAERCDVVQAGERLVEEISGRVDVVRAAVRGADERPRVAVLEWLDPVFVAGHWTPQLVELAGGDDVLGLPGEPSETQEWSLVAAAAPQVAVVVPCGFDAAGAAEQAAAHARELAATGVRTAVALEASGWFSRPGPRLVEGLEALAHVLHPEAAAAGGVPEPPAGSVREVALAVPAR